MSLCKSLNECNDYKKQNGYNVNQYVGYNLIKEFLRDHRNQYYGDNKIETFEYLKQIEDETKESKEFIEYLLRKLYDVENLEEII